MTVKRKIATAVGIVLVMSISSFQFGPSLIKEGINVPDNTVLQSSQPGPSRIMEEINPDGNAANHSVQTNDDFQSLFVYGQTLDSLISAKTIERRLIQKEFYRRLAIAVAKQDGRFRWNILYGIWMRESGLDRKNFKGDGIPGRNGVIIWRAFGVGQVHIPTGKSHYNRNVTENDLLDPIKGGFASGRILGDYIAMFNGDVIAGISAYNQGPVYTKRHIKNRQALKNLSYVTEVLYYAATALATDTNGLVVSKY